jgi:HJR/Mrr/RecB family endonuclease
MTTSSQHPARQQISTTSADSTRIFDDAMTGREFELYCRDVLQEAGWRAPLTPGSGDQGADIIAEKDDRRVVIQCKFWHRQLNAFTRSFRYLGPERATDFQ